MFSLIVLFAGRTESDRKYILSIVIFACGSAQFALAAKDPPLWIAPLNGISSDTELFEPALLSPEDGSRLARVMKTVADEDEHCGLHVMRLASGTHGKLGKTPQIALALQGSDASGRGCLVAAHRQVELPFGLGTIIAAPDPETPVSDRITHAERRIGSLNKGHSPMAFQHSEHTQRHNDTSDN